jgi:hypothetical protein
MAAWVLLFVAGIVIGSQVFSVTLYQQSQKTGSSGSSHGRRGGCHANATS